LYEAPNRTQEPASTPSEWWTRPLHELSGSEASITGSISRTLVHLVRSSGLVSSRALAHVVWAFGWRAARDERGRPQVAISYVERGAGVSRTTARRALDAVSKVLGCGRIEGGYWTAIPEALDAAHLATSRLLDLGLLQRPEIHQEDRDEPGDVRFLVALPDGSRGKARCPCGHHDHGDRHASLAFDMETGLATCQKTRAVFRLHGDGTASILRQPYAASEQVKQAMAPMHTHEPSGPGVGTLPSTPPGIEYDPNLPGYALTGTLGAHHLRGGLGVSYLRRSYSRARTLAGFLRWSDTQYNGPKAMERARVVVAATQDAEEADLLHADRLFSLDRYGLRCEWRETRTGQRFPAVVEHVPIGTRHTLLDLDGLNESSTDPGSVEDLDGLVRRLRSAVDTASGGRLDVEAVTATSREGVQIVLRWFRWFNADRLYGSRFLRSVLCRAGEAVLRVIGRGGHVDQSAWAPGRLARRPGVRVRRGRVVQSRLWWVDAAPLQP